MELSWDLLSNLAGQYGESFYLLNLKRFDANYRDFQSAFQSIYPHTRLAFSYKTNYTPALCRYANSLGSYAEVVSMMEYDLAIQVGVAPGNIIFNGPLKTASDIEKAVKAGSTVNLDSFHEALLVGILARKEPELEISVGIRCNFDIGTDYVSRFGCDVGGGEVDRIFEYLGKISNCRVKGLHCHFSTPHRSIGSYYLRAKKMIEISKACFGDRIPDFLDLGGGFFGEIDKDFAKQFAFYCPTYEDYAQAIAPQFKEAYPQDRGPELILEPGIALLGNVMKFVCMISAVKSVGTQKLAVSTGSIYNVKPTFNEKNLPITVYRKETNSTLSEEAMG
ncbi:MAG: hypothetical protein P8013_13360, partial [Candidatus Sulfobium sp.]